MGCSVVRERYTPIPITSNTTIQLSGNSVGGFLAQTAGTISLTANPQDGKAGTTLLTAFPVVAGIYYPLPFYLSSNGGTFTTAGGATGVLGV